MDEACTQAVLIDFGIATELAQEAIETSLPEALEGTLAYISPEQTGRTARGIDSRTDLYSLGVTLFEMLIGQKPFVETDPLSLVYAHLAKAPPALERLLPSLPSIVARLVERCLEKSPEKRYQTAKGLGADLERCLRQLEDDGRIVPFALGQRDFSPRLQISQTLVSREEESQAVIAAFEHAAQGGVEVLLLGGPSGVGKTALVRSVYREIARTERGLLLCGKHDQLGSSVPYAALAQAFAGLMSSLAASPKPVFDAWRNRLDQALGPLSRVIADLVPELEWLMGTLPAVPVVPTEMAYNRFKLSWIDFVRAVTDASPPLVLFLDDMQWVDPASLELLKTLFTDIGRRHLLVIAAYRDNEVEPNHPLWKLIEAVSKSGVRTSRLSLGPLSEGAAQTWLAATLSTDPTQVAPLATALHRKTQGNPFFLGQLLIELHRQKRVRRNLEDGNWQWDQDAVERADATDNVVELMRSKVVELSERTQDLLGQAACAGHSFALGELAVLAALPIAQVSQELWPALQMGLVIPNSGQYREVHALAGTNPHSELDASYRFLHDRVQQAFYERIMPEQRARTHLQIGRRLQTLYKEQGGSHQKLLELTRHLNLGAGALSNLDERRDLAQLNLQAAKAAKTSGLYRLQASLVEQAHGLLGKQVWDSEPQLAVELALERIEADYMLREFDEVHRRVQELLALPLPVLPRLAAQELRVRACVASGQFSEGERLGLLALAEQGIHYPQTNEEYITEVSQRLRQCGTWLQMHPEGFGAMPAEHGLEHLLWDALQTAMLLCAGMGTHPALAVLAMARTVEHSISRSTLTPIVPFCISALASGHAVFFGEYREGVSWAEEGVQAAERLASPFFPLCSALRGFFGVYEKPVEETRVYYQAGFRAARASGSFQGTSWALWGEIYYVDLWGGRPLEQVQASEAAHRELMTRAGDALGQHYFALIDSYTSFLRATFRGSPVADSEWLTLNSRTFLSMGDGVVAELARILEAHLFLVFGQYARALYRAAEAEQFRPAIHGNPPATDIALWHGLAAAKCCLPTLSPAQHSTYLSTLDHSIEVFRYLAAGCAENFLHKLRLLEAERLRLSGKIEEAMAAYDAAISLAKKAHFLHIAATAAQFCAEFHLAAGRERIAALYMQEARSAYSSWNALAITCFLEQKYPSLLLPAGSGWTPINYEATEASATRTTGKSAIDVETTVRAAQALASELNPQRVVIALMRLLQGNSGAQGAALLLYKNEQLSLSAVLTGSEVRADLAEPLSASHPVGQSVVRYVLRSREALILSNVPGDSRFAEDPHLQAAGIRSVLAVPLLHQGRLGGILYLEHETANAFPAARVHLVGVLAAQSAIALENAQLYVDLQTANAGLEAKVAQRTAALDKALSDLWTEMDLAQKIQTVLLPRNPQIPGYDMAAVMRPTDQVGGDYYDVFQHGGQNWVLIGDVSGHGVTAGLSMMMIQTALRTAALTLSRTKQPLTPRRLLGLVNEAIQNNLQQIGRSQYMTITALCIEGDTVRYSGLHQDLLVYRAATKEVQQIETQGIWLGISDSDISEFLQDDELRLDEGDILLLFTDGYTEAKVEGGILDATGLAKRFAKLAGHASSSTALIPPCL